ncbi:MAG: hypothetical protein M3Y28_05770 [Armatimonadota bacterium]|nr:hypothetical protein [Armatimonadota bacterium]
MLKDFRESFAGDLHDPEFQREFIAAYYEEEGFDGLLRALKVITDAKRDRQAAAENPEAARPPGGHKRARRLDPAFRSVRAALNALDLDLTVVRKG